MNLIFDGMFGSKLYGTNTPTSDTDYKSIFIPTSREIVLGGKEHFTNNTGNDESKNSPDDMDREYFSLKNFIHLAKKGETIAIDMIHTPDHMNMANANPHWDFIRKNRAKLYTTDMKAYLGYVKKQAHKYGIKGSRLSALRLVRDWSQTLPEIKPVVMESAQNKRRVKNVSWVEGVMHQDTILADFLSSAPIDKDHAFIENIKGSMYYKILSSAFQETLSIKNFKNSIERMWNAYGERARQAEQNEGIDWKSLHHAVRGGLQLMEIYETGDLKYPLAQKDLLIQIKNGEMPYKEVSQILDDVVDDVERLTLVASANGMPEKVDSKFWDDFVYDVYSDVVAKSVVIAHKDY